MTILVVIMNERQFQTESLLEQFLFYLFIFILFILSVCVCMHTTVQMWRSQDNLWQSVTSFSHVDLGAGAFTC